MLGMDSAGAGRGSPRGGLYRDPGGDIGGRARGNNRGGGQSVSGCILEVELMGFPDGLDVGWKRKRGVRHNRKGYVLCS